MELAARWSSLDDLLAAHGDLRLDLGCGFVKEPGHVGLDDLRGVEGLAGQAEGADNGADVFLDISAERWPFADGSVAAVRSRHFLEHSLLDHVFAESHRVLRPGGGFVAIVPYANSADGMSPGHNVFLTERFFELNPSFQAKFEITRITYRQSDEWLRWPRMLRRLIPFDWARVHLYNVCKEMRVEAVRRS
jgi:SAM-dependent methyltransferase